MMRLAAIVILGIVFLASLAPVSYDTQSREAISAPPSRQFPLGTDDLGRDRFSRLLYGTRISLFLAPCAALVTLLIGAAVGITAGFAGGWWEGLAMRITDLFLSLPWLFLFIIVRALLPLNTSPLISLTVTFLLMGILGWAPSARVIRSAVKQFRTADFVLEARACGCSESRIWIAWLAPRLRGIFVTQFFISIPVFILGEASLGILGLGVSEPMPSWGNLLRELSSAPPLNQYWIFAPVALLVIVMTCFQVLIPHQESQL
jgi:ABC-type dipeptide/oligopeptide/nickel transport system permease subunit